MTRSVPTDSPKSRGQADSEKIAAEKALNGPMSANVQGVTENNGGPPKSGGKWEKQDGKPGEKNATLY